MVRQRLSEFAPPGQLKRSASFLRKEQLCCTGVLDSVNLSKVSNAIRGLLLLVSLLLIFGLGSCYVGQRQWERELHESERQMEATGFFISDTPGPDTNNWQFAGALILLVSFSVAMAAFMLWRQDTKS